MYRINKGLIPATAAERNAMPAEDQIAFIQFAQEMESLGLLVMDGVIDLTLVNEPWALSSSPPGSVTSLSSPRCARPPTIPIWANISRASPN